MSKIAHVIYISVMVSIVSIVFIWLYYTGISYYKTSLEERFFHPSHNLLKPSGSLGHGLGIAGSLFIIIGISAYMARKRFRYLSRIGKLKHWLEFHIFLCTLGTVLVLFHTSFKFGGIVAVSFWSMVAVFLSGIAGRFIYIQIPRTIEGRELSLKEVRELKAGIGEIIRNDYHLTDEQFRQIIAPVSEDTAKRRGIFLLGYFTNFIYDFRVIRQIKSQLKMNGMSKSVITKISRLVKNDISLNRKIERLNTMQKLFNYWHVAHLPFALVMLIIMVIHVAITIVFGYKWIF
jgi:hypothetical protein